MRRLSSGFLALSGIFVVFSLPAWADDRDSCNNLTGDESIAACTRLIASKELQGGDLARAYRSRALSSTLADLGCVGEGIFHALPDMARNFDTVSARP